MKHILSSALFLSSAASVLAIPAPIFTHEAFVRFNHQQPGFRAFVGEHAAALLYSSDPSTEPFRLRGLNCGGRWYPLSSVWDDDRLMSFQAQAASLCANAASFVHLDVPSVSFSAPTTFNDVADFSKFALRVLGSKFVDTEIPRVLIGPQSINELPITAATISVRRLDSQDPLDNGDLKSGFKVYELPDFFLQVASDFAYYFRWFHSDLESDWDEFFLGPFETLVIRSELTSLRAEIKLHLNDASEVDDVTISVKCSENGPLERLPMNGPLDDIVTEAWKTGREAAVVDAVMEKGYFAFARLCSGMYMIDPELEDLMRSDAMLDMARVVV